MPIETGTWSDKENRLFQRAFAIYGKNWNLISRIVKTRTISQIRSHAQKAIPKTIKKRRQTYQRRHIYRRRYSRARRPAPPNYRPPTYPYPRPIRRAVPKRPKKISKKTKKKTQPRPRRAQPQRRQANQVPVQEHLTQRRIRSQRVVVLIPPQKQQLGNERENQDRRGTR